MNEYEIKQKAIAIRNDVMEKFPEYRNVLMGLCFRVSNRTTRSLGTCRYRYGKAFEIVISFNAFKHEANVTELPDTVLHEIAHAIAGNLAGHGPAWKAVARKIGARTQRVCTTLAVSPVELVTIQCHVCQGDLKVTKRKARGGRRYRHTTCKPTAPQDLLRKFLGEL